VPRERLRHVERDLAACEIDRWLRVLGRQEALCRSALGRLAAVFLRQRAQHRLGFSRIGDYTRERLGISARELQTAARVVMALATLPRLASAFDAGELSWTQVRILVTVATPATEARWLEVARGRTVRTLEALAAEARAATSAPASTRGAVGDTTTGSGMTGTAGNDGGSGPGCGVSAAVSATDGVDDSHMDGEPRVRFHLRCPRRVRRLWHRAIELARRMVGTDGPVWQAAEAVAAEGLAAPQSSGDEWEPAASEVIDRDDAIAHDMQEDTMDGGRPSGWRLRGRHRWWRCCTPPWPRFARPGTRAGPGSSACWRM
jgi:hypothetical protein